VLSELCAPEDLPDLDFDAALVGVVLAEDLTITKYTFIKYSNISTILYQIKNLHHASKTFYIKTNRCEAEQNFKAQT